jgi:hypothetical protein
MVCTSYLVYSQIWLHFPRDDRHFFDILLRTITTLATRKKLLNRKKHCSSDSGVVGTACVFHDRNVHPGNYIQYVMPQPVSQEMGGMSCTYTRTGSSSASPVLPRTVCGCRSKDASCSQKTAQERLHGVLVCAQF